MALLKIFIPKRKRKFINRVSVGCKDQGTASDFELGIISAEPPLSRFWFSDLQDQNVNTIRALRR